MVPEIGHIVEIDIKITIEEGEIITTEVIKEIRESNYRDNSRSRDRNGYRDGNRYNHRSNYRGDDGNQRIQS